MSTDEFKLTLDNFYNKIKTYITDNKALETLSETYNHICDSFNQMTIISDGYIINLRGIRRI